MVGARGFEPPTPCSQSRCATRLRHAPIFTKFIPHFTLKNQENYEDEVLLQQLLIYLSIDFGAI